MIFVITGFIGVVGGMLVEYWGHRLEHWRMFRPVDHSLHHIANTSGGWLREFWADLKYAIVPVVLIAAALSVVSVDVAIGLCGGFLAHLAFSAYAHELYHSDPSLVFWIRPIHHFHHENRQWKKNFGITNTIMDRLFGTFLDDPTWTRKRVRVRDLFTARWM